MSGRCKNRGAPVPLVVRKKKPRAFCVGCRANIGEFNGAAKLTTSRGLSDPASTAPLFARGRDVRHLSTDLLRYP